MLAGAPPSEQVPRAAWAALTERQKLKTVKRALMKTSAITKRAVVLAGSIRRHDLGALARRIVSYRAVRFSLLTHPQVWSQHCPSHQLPLVRAGLDTLCTCPVASYKSCDAAKACAAR